jgi:site-specific recombinase XerD
MVGVLAALPVGNRAATLLLDAAVPIEGVQDLLDHKHITTTQIYDKRRLAVKNSASHKMPI